MIVFEKHYVFKSSVSDQLDSGILNLSCSYRQIKMLEKWKDLNLDLDLHLRLRLRPRRFTFLLFQLAN